MDAFFKATEAERFTCLNVKHPDAASAFGCFFKSFNQWNTTEDRRLTDLREADKREWPEKAQAAREAGKLGDRFVLAGFEVDRANRAFTTF